MESIRIRAPKNRRKSTIREQCVGQSEQSTNVQSNMSSSEFLDAVLAQAEIGEMLANMESQCNEAQKKKFATLFSSRPKNTKKQKKMAKEVT